MLGRVDVMVFVSESVAEPQFVAFTVRDLRPGKEVFSPTSSTPTTWLRELPFIQADTLQRTLDVEEAILDVD